MRAEGWRGMKKPGVRSQEPEEEAARALVLILASDS
jgi:hypothetical protein